MVSWKVWKRTHQRQWTLVGGALILNSLFYKKTNKYLEKLISLIRIRVGLIRAERTARSVSCTDLTFTPFFVLSWSASILLRKNFVLRLFVRPGKNSTSEKCLDFQGSTHHWRSVLGPSGPHRARTRAFWNWTVIFQNFDYQLNTINNKMQVTH